MIGRIISFLRWKKSKKPHCDGLVGLFRFLRALSSVHISNSRCAHFQDDGSAISQLAAIYERFNGRMEDVREYLEAEQMGHISRARILVAVWVKRKFLVQTVGHNLSQAA